ncbi:MAG: hypothetical protein HC834_06825 [Rhodospirillales bacterium]|nr:hypothetical protein [Rhodospirillales bacterium]
MKAWVGGILAALVVLAVGGCESRNEALSFYPLTTGAVWNYRMIIREGTEPEARTLQTSSTVVNLKQVSFDGSTVTPQQTSAFGQAQNRLIQVFDDGVAEVAVQPDPDAAPIPRTPPNYVIKMPLRVGSTWTSSWQSNQFEQTTLIPITKTVAMTDGTIRVPPANIPVA